MGSIEVSKTSLVEIHYLPCVKCGSDNIDFNDCGYSSFNIAWGKCKNCGNEFKFSCGWDVTKEEIIKNWNNHNNPETLRANYQKQITELQKLIDALPKAIQP